MTAALASLIDVASNVGIPLLILVVAVETMGVPVPGETALITAGVLASQGKLPIIGVIAAAAGAAILGDNVGFFIGRHFGRRILTAPGPLAGHRQRIIDIGEPFFAKHGPKAVFLGRWVSGLRITASWMAGITHMKWPTFTFFNALGGIAWATSIGLASYYAGDQAKHIIHTVGLGGLALVVLVAATAWIVVHRRGHPDDPEGEVSSAAVAVAPDEDAG